jgi:hypothetical protein
MAAARATMTSAAAPIISTAAAEADSRNEDADLCSGRCRKRRSRHRRRRQNKRERERLKTEDTADFTPTKFSPAHDSPAWSCAFQSEQLAENKTGHTVTAFARQDWMMP